MPIHSQGEEMAGIHFSFYDFTPLTQLNIGIADRLDDNRKESFTILFCDFSALSKEVITQSMEQVLRTSDAIVHYDNYYFFFLPYTDKYGAVIVKNMFEEFFDTYIPSAEVSYPVNGDTPTELFESLQVGAKKLHNLDLEFLDEGRMKKVLSQKA